MGYFSAAEKRQGVSLEDPNVSLGGTKLIELLGGGREAATGRRVSEQSALNFSAVWASVNMISGTFATLPGKLYSRRDDGGKDEERSHPVWSIIHDRPNPEMTAASYKEASQGHLLTHGNGYSEIVLNNGGDVAEVWPLDPRRVRRAGRRYLVETEGGREVPIQPDRMLHVAGLGFDGRTGYGVIRMARESIALGLAPEEYAARFYGNNSRPAGILTSEQALGPDAQRRLKSAWEKVQGGLDNAHRVAVLEQGIQWQQIGLSHEDAEFLETRKFQVREIARWFNIPPHKIRDLENATFTNIEEENAGFVVDTIRPWLVRWEQEINAKLLTERERAAGLFVEFVVDGLLRGDTEKRGQWYRERFNTGSITPNEIRSLENQNPIEGGDRAFIQLNMIPLEQALTMSSQERATLLLAEKGVAPAVHTEARTETRSPAGRIRLRERFRLSLTDAALRVVSREIADVRTQSERLMGDGEPSAFLTWLQRYYFGEQPDYFRTVMRPHLATYAEVVAPLAAAEMGSEEPDDVARFMDDYVTAAANTYARSSRSQLEGLVRDGRDDADAPEPVQAIEQRLSEWDEGKGDARPRHVRLADRHIVEANEAVSRHAWAAAGAMGIVSVAVGDSCPYCLDLDGRRVGIREPFVRKGEAFQPDGADAPLKPSSNLHHPPYHGGCDCTTRPSIL